MQSKFKSDLFGNRIRITQLIDETNSSFLENNFLNITKILKNNINIETFLNDIILNFTNINRKKIR